MRVRGLLICEKFTKFTSRGDLNADAIEWITRDPMITVALGWKNRVNERCRWEIENLFVGSFVEGEGRRKNEENKFLSVKVTIVCNSGLLMNGKYFKYYYCRKRLKKVRGNEKFFVNDLYSLALDCPTSTKVRRNNIIQKRNYSRE